MNRGILACVAIVAAALVAGPPVLLAPASAAPVPCTQTFTQVFTGSEGFVPEGQTRGFVVDVPATAFLAGATVADVDVQIAFGGSRSATISAVGPGGSRQLLQSSGLGYEDYDVTFDDEAPTDWAPTVKGGRARPAATLSAYDGKQAAGGWGASVNATFGYGHLVMRSVSVVITSTGCDSDGDGAPESTDNCANVANADQADWDGDGSGNACDSSPGTAPTPAPVTPAPSATATAPPPSATTSGCTVGCAYARAVDLTYQAARHRLRGSVASPAVGCRSGVPVTIWRQRSGADRKLVVVTTRASGTFLTKAPRAAGRYYATVSSADQALCASDASPSVRIRRR